MGADQRKRRLNSSSDFGHGRRVQQREKKKMSVSRLYCLNPHISLKWDEDEKRVVAKGEQIGLSWRHLGSFIAPHPHKKGTLADVINIPTDVFDMNNLKELVSYEAWRSLLSEQERDYLKQFLPGEIDPEQVVKPLLVGDNIHFGSPFMKWGISLCSGDLHPDAVLHREQTFRANKKAYYSNLQKYHANMIGYLQNMKVSCANSSDSEAVILQMARSIGGIESNHKTSHDSEEHIPGTFESCSSIAEEKACTVDNLNLSDIKGHELHESKHLRKDKNEQPAGYPEGLNVLLKTRQSEKQQKVNTNYDDGTKYMSYVMISKKQHELVKSLKQSGNSFQSGALTGILGNLDSFNVKPFEMFEKEEQNKILDYWSNLANKDVPAAFVNWKGMQAMRLQILTSLCQEMDRKPNNQIEDEDETSIETSQHQQGDEVSADQSSLDDNSASHASSMDDQSFQIPSLNGGREFCPVDLNAEDNTVDLETSDCNGSADVGGPRNIVDYPKNHCPVEVDKNEQLHHSAVIDGWCPANIQRASSSVEYASSLGCQRAIKEKPGDFIGVESEILEEDPSRDFLRQQSIEMPYLNYQNHDRNDPQPSFLKHDGYPRQQRTEMDFSPIMGHVREQLRQPFPMDHDRKVGNDIFMPQNIVGKIYPNEHAFALPMGENFCHTRAGEWGNSHILATNHSILGSGEMLNHGWLLGDNRVTDVWAGPGANGFSNQGVVGGIGGDQSLFSVLPQFNNLRSLPSLGAMGAKIPTMNYGEGMGAVIPRTMSHLPQGTSVLEYSSVQEGAAAGASRSSSMGMSLPRQMTTLHDPTEKSFLKSWN